jgi:hypothetical protein
MMTGKHDVVAWMGACYAKFAKVADWYFVGRTYWKYCEHRRLIGESLVEG